MNSKFILILINSTLVNFNDSKIGINLIILCRYLYMSIMFIFVFVADTIMLSSGTNSILIIRS